AISEHGLREAQTAVDAIVADSVPEITMDSTEEDIIRELQLRNGLSIVLEKKRLAAVARPVRVPFERALRTLTDAEQDLKELKARKRAIPFTRILEEVELTFPVGAAPADGEPPVKDAITKQYVKRAAESIYKDPVRKKLPVEKRLPDGRGTEEIRPIECEVG